MMVDVLPDSRTNDVDMEIEPTLEVIPEIPFHTFAGTTHPQTFRVIGKVKNKDVMVLIEGGSTHNFID